VVLLTAFAAGAAWPPTAVAGLSYTNDFFPGVTYRAEVPSPERLLGFPLAQRAATAGEIEGCLRAWASAAPDRTRLVEYARSHENRPLCYMVVTAPRNLDRREEIQAALARLGDPRRTSGAEAQELIATLPAVAWLGYTIHGDETEGSDAALAVLYYLIAGTDPQGERLREKLVIILDPLMNPDGRDRFLKMVAENRGTAPNLDDQSLLHGGYWPWGRGNHYLFDLNRDWIWGVHPETRGRIREVAKWNPVLFVDAHGMGAQETHLFSPPREPINPNMPSGRERLGTLFLRDQAGAFDRHGLVYYHGEWHEEWYPGYSDAWCSYRGALGILYEQARIAEDGVRRPEGRILTYRESVHHHVIGNLANLASLEANSRSVLEHFYRTRQEAVDPQGRYGRRTFALLPTANRSRMRSLIELLDLQGFEVFVSPEGFVAPTATDALGRELQEIPIPAGTVLVPNCQPLGHLLAAMLEFDPRMSASTLEEERQELLRKGRSRLYDHTAWNVTMMYGLEALTLPMAMPASARPYAAPGEDRSAVARSPEVPVAYVLDGADDRSVTAAARLLERGVQVRVAEKAFRFEDHAFARGSVVVTALDNRDRATDLRRLVAEAAQELGLTAVPVGSGLGPGDLPDLGGRYFRHLEPPRIALLSRGGVNLGDFGCLWFTLDHDLGIRHSQVEERESLDLRRYNVLILPDRGGGLPSGLMTSLKEWVRAGGTLVAVANAAAAVATEKAEFSKVRPLPEVLGKLGDYELTILREWLGRSGDVPAADRLWAHLADPALRYPWQAVDGAHPEEKELKKRDAWQNLFMPQGALLASRVDTNHWLSFGCGEMLPILVGRQPILMAADDVEAPIRYGLLTATNPAAVTRPAADPAPAPSASALSTEAGDKKEKKEPPRVGWSALPPGAQMHLRMSGLLWPEASHRLANAACVTREAYGRGQIILFATPPTTRAATRGTARVLLNAVVYGPGCGTARRIEP
jgi:hypothetical protein